MFVACNTLCFSDHPLETGLRQIRDLEFSRIELAVHESGTHLKPSEVARDPDGALQRLRQGPSLTPVVLDLDFGTDLDDRTLNRRFEAICRLAKPLTIAVLVMPAAEAGTPIDEEIARLSGLSTIANAEGLVLTVATESHTLAGDPKTALALCQNVPGLALTFDPSHFVQGPHRKANLDKLYPLIEHVRFRDTGPKPEQFQVRIGQGHIEYGRIATQLERHGYQRALSVSINDRLPHNFDIEVEVRKLKLLLESLI